MDASFFFFFISCVPFFLPYISSLRALHVEARCYIQCTLRVSLFFAAVACVRCLLRHSPHARKSFDQTKLVPVLDIAICWEEGGRGDAGRHVLMPTV